MGESPKVYEHLAKMDAQVQLNETVPEQEELLPRHTKTYLWKQALCDKI